jgi:hypothetical protein
MYSVANIIVLAFRAFGFDTLVYLAGSARKSGRSKVAPRVPPAELLPPDTSEEEECVCRFFPIIEQTSISCSLVFVYSERFIVPLASGSDRELGFSGAIRDFETLAV